MRTIVYVDAFNLYYGCLRGSPYKWLDLVALCRVVLPKNQVECIKYFTARVGARPGAAGQPTRQQLYLRALETLKPIVEIYYGHYLSHVVRMRWRTLRVSAPDLWRSSRPRRRDRTSTSRPT